jgi:4-oxalomesaconate tautomerase
MWMRGGTSKGGYFLLEDLPADKDERDRFLLRIMGSPDKRQIDGMGGANPLTSKVAVVSRSNRRDADLDYLFLQVFVDRALVSDAQNCGNILAGVGPFAIERGLVKADGAQTSVRIYMQNTAQFATATVETPGGQVTYDGPARIDGVPGRAAPVPILFKNTAGSTCGVLLPTGNTADDIEGTEATLIDNGMPCVVMRAADFGLTGEESPAALEARAGLKAKIEAIRLKAGPRMALGDVSDKTVPKVVLVSPATAGGVVATRTFIPHMVHEAIGVFGAISTASACLLKSGPAAGLAVIPGGKAKSLSVEHPTGEITVLAELDGQGAVAVTGVLRTARKLFDGVVY